MIPYMDNKKEKPMKYRVIFKYEEEVEATDPKEALIALGNDYNNWEFLSNPIVEPVYD